MKRSLRRKSRRPESRPAEEAPPAQAGFFRVPYGVVLFLSLILATAATWAGFEFVVWSKIPSRLVGKWVIEGGEQDGATLDFFRNGTMLGRMNVRGSLAIVNGRVSVDGNKLIITTQNPQTKVDETRTQRITLLTDKELALEDGQGKVFRLSRATE